MYHDFSAYFLFTIFDVTVKNKKNWYVDLYEIFYHTSVLSVTLKISYSNYFLFSSINTTDPTKILPTTDILKIILKLQNYYAVHIYHVN